MKNLIATIVFFIRLFVFVKVVSFLYQTRNGFPSNTIDDAIWLILLLVFDMWFLSTIANLQVQIEEKEDSNKD